MSFSDLQLSAPLLKAIKQQGYEQPSPIQEQAIPAVLRGDDVMAAAQTGTGKTAGFTLPILENLIDGPKAKGNQTRVLILTPTRELAAQVAANVATYSQYLPISSAVVFGGVKINPQMINLKKGVDILIATPGRLLDLHSQNAIRFKQLEVLVLDEADRMLDMGFLPDIRRIMKLLPKQRQNLLFSATFSPSIRALAKTIVNKPVEVSVAPANATAAKVKQWLCPVDKKAKSKVLAKLIHDRDWGQVLVFTRTKHGANRLTRELERHHIMATAIHGNKSQAARTRALAEFKQGEVQVLVATDIAARGLDIHQLPHVVNFDLPNVAADYVHRIGRTGRAGAEGEAVSLVCADELDELIDIERLIGRLLPREILPGFEPQQHLVETQLDSRPPRKKKPKKPSKPRSHKDGRSDQSASGNRRTAQHTAANSKKKSTGFLEGNSQGKLNGKPGEKPKSKRSRRPKKTADVNGNVKSSSRRTSAQQDSASQSPWGRRT
jgi:ATP-dependent RNA helicase RhlE